MIVHFLDKALHLHDKQPSQQDKEIAKEILSKDDLLSAIESFVKCKSTELHLFSKNPDKLKSDLISLYKLIEAAGGVVINEKKELLMIYRNDCWDLPKGKIEKDEDVEAAAIREVMEECGIEYGLSIIKPLQTTYHHYKLNGEEILKKTYWFEMTCDYEKKLQPQLEEGITKVEWVPKDEVRAKAAKSYASIRQVLNL